MQKIYVVIPAYEPDEKLVELCRNLKANKIDDIVVVNDGTVGSVTVFKEITDEFPDIVILNHDKNMGKGRALKTAFSYLIEKTDAEGCITADSDGQHRTDDILKCMEVLSENPQCVILGCRQFDWTETPFKSRVGNKFTLKLFHFCTGHEVSDTQTGLRGLPKKCIAECINLDGERFEFEMNMLVTFACKYELKEVPIACVYNSNNKGTHFRALKDSLKVIKTMHKAAKNAKKTKTEENTV